jgi:hypothetical protein
MMGGNPKHVEQFPGINKLYNVASCWIYIGILLAHPILHIDRIRVNTGVRRRALRLPVVTLPFRTRWIYDVHGK